MFPLWDDVIAPVIDAVGARRIIEIGALRGETTTRVFKRLGSDCELHVIDPEPQFDPAEHEQAFPGRYRFHRGTSLEVLPGLPAADVVLVDGDHNWFTAYHELQLLAATARKAAAPLPVVLLHDVGWPYGRRDLYYAPERIPPEFRQPHRRAGLRLGQSALVEGGGMNREVDNAEHEGGPRNGVMTAVDDFIAEQPQPLRVVLVPIFYGLAIVADERVLTAHPELTAFLDHLESEEGRGALVDLAERIRVEEQIFTQAWVRMLDQRIQRETDRYLEVVKSILLGEHSRDDEVRLAYLLAMRGVQPDLAALRDPARTLQVRYHRLERARIAGRPVDNGLGNLALTTMGRAQLNRLGEAAGRVVAAGVPGDFADVGVGGGGGGILLRATLEAHEVADRRVWLADPFLATTPAGDADESSGPEKLPPEVRRLASDLNQVRDGFARFGLLDDRVRFLQGVPSDVLVEAPIDRLAVLRLGQGLGRNVGSCLELLHGRLSAGAEVIVSGTADRAVETSLARARERLGITAPLERIDWNSVTWRHDGATRPTEPAEVEKDPDGAKTRCRAQTAGHPLLAPPAPTPALALSVVVIFYNMRREAARTLQSLARSYQRGVDDLDYEVLAIDNGSSPDQRLGRDFVSSFGPEFRLLELDDDPHPSPTVALNAGIAAARGDALALMIDGAHVLTPGVLRFGTEALHNYAPAVVAAQQWYVGPRQQQGDAHQEGYDQALEDRLFERIEWPIDGYRLFDIGHFVGDRDWFDGIPESNCLFVPRKLLEQVGGLDESFSMPGGGYANLELFERLGLSPDVTPVSILGEGTFHQFHGGNTTNVADEGERRARVVSYREHFEELRGRPLTGLDDPVHYVGAMGTKAARRTRSRRQLAVRFDVKREPTDIPESTVPVSDELKLAAIEGVWAHQAWREATWLGHPVNRYPADLHVYQELLARTRPSVVLLAADDVGLGGRALFVASVCEQLGHGQVVAVGGVPVPERPGHPRVTHVAGAPEDPATGDRLAAEALGSDDVLVIVGLGSVDRVIATFERYAPMVPLGGYVVVENTVVNGRPVASGFGPGPHEAVVDIITRRGDFVPDPGCERYTLTFNRGGYLKRIRQ